MSTVQLLNKDAFEFLNREDLFGRNEVTTKIDGKKLNNNNLNQNRKLVTAFNKLCKRSSKVMIEIPVYDIKVTHEESYNSNGERMLVPKYEGYYKTQSVVENHFLRQSGFYATSENVKFRYFNRVEEKEMTISKEMVKGFADFLMFRQCLEEPDVNNKNKSLEKEFKKCRNAIFNGIEGYFVQDEDGSKIFIEVKPGSSIPEGAERYKYEYFCSSQSQVLNVKGAWIDRRYKVPEHIIQSIKDKASNSSSNKDKCYPAFLSSLRGAKAAIEISTYGSWSRELSNIYDNWYAMYRLRKVKTLKKGL